MKIWLVVGAFLLTSCDIAPQTSEPFKKKELPTQIILFGADFDDMKLGDLIADGKKFPIYRNSKIYTQTIVDPALKVHPEMQFYGVEYWDKNFAGAHISGKEELKSLENRIRKNYVSLQKGGNGRNDGKNVKITFFYGLNDISQPYTMRVTIRQGKLFWSKNVERDGVKNWSPIGEYPKAMGPHHDRMANVFGNDQVALSEAVSQMLCLAEEC